MPYMTMGYEVFHCGSPDLNNQLRAGNTLLLLDPPDRAAVHYRIARQYQGTDTAQARRNVLLALEEAPRFRKAHALLAELSITPQMPIEKGSLDQ